MRYVIADDHRVYRFSKEDPPALRVPPGSVVEFAVRDCFDGQIDWSSFPECLDGIDLSRVNPATGPLFVEGAGPGDTLEVEILGVKVDGMGFVDRMRFPISGGKAELPGGAILPIRPVIGVIGVAPDGEPVDTKTPGDHGGNLDTADITVGSKVYLPVQVEGALLAMGDLHALQGDGEVSGQGIEIGGRVTVRVDVARLDLPRKPVVELDDRICIIASAPSLDEACDEAVKASKEWLSRRLNISEREALILMSLTCDLRISQIVNPLKTVRLCIPKAVLKPNPSSSEV